jgi:hypothetical protein
MQVLDELGVTDDGATALHANLRDKLQIAQEATDAALTRSLAQAFEAFGEAWAYRRLSRCLKISKIPEGDDPGPDFQCELDGREFFVEPPQQKHIADRAEILVRGFAPPRRPDGGGRLQK